MQAKHNLFISVYYVALNTSRLPLATISEMLIALLFCIFTLASYAITVIVINILFIYTFFAYEHAPIWEWVAVFSALIWVAMLAYNTLKLDNAANTP